MKTPKQKANDLVDKFIDAQEITDLDEAKQYALICVVEIIRAIEAFGYGEIFYDHEEEGIVSSDDIYPYDYWIKVKKEIQK